VARALRHAVVSRLARTLALAKPIRDMPEQNILLLIYFVAFFLLAFVIRSVLVYRSTGINPLVLPRTQDAYGYVGMAFKLLMLGCAAVVSLLAFAPNASTWLGPITQLEITPIKGLGWSCLLVSLLWMLVAQAQMGASWRIGIDSANRTELVSKGLFSISRNPIFLATRLALLGFFLVAPNAATSAILAAAEIVIQVQVRLEEKHLSGLHGSAYEQYFSKVPRWL
jgi:protein-S-isoprenylcysteine O-methyltransferase Ste14